MNKNINFEKIDFNKNQKMMIISIITFLCVLISATYAWITNDLFESNQSMSLTSAGLELTFRGTSQEIIADLAPGEEATKTFEVTNYASGTSTYNLYWKTAENRFTNRNYFKYTIINADTNTELITPRYLPSNVTGILHNISIAGNTTHRYILKVTYVEDPLYNQIQNADQYFYGDVSIRQASSSLGITAVSSLYLDGINIDYIPTLSEVTLDASRTYCTDGASISIVDGELQIQNQTLMTSCAVYFTTVTPTAVDKNIYNLLIVDLNGGTSSVNTVNYYYRNEIIDLGTPVRSGYAFTGWQISGAGSSLIKNTRVKMGTTYTYAKATWVKGYWNKTTQTCAPNSIATYDKTYKTCDTVFQNYTKVDKLCTVQTSAQNIYSCVASEYTKRTCTCKGSKTHLGWSGTCHRAYQVASCSSCPGNCQCTAGAVAVVTCYCYSTKSCVAATCPGGYTGTCTETFTYSAGWSCSDSTDTTCTESDSWVCTYDRRNMSRVDSCTETAWEQDSLTSSSTVTSCTEDLTCTSTTDTYTTCTPNYGFNASVTTSPNPTTCTANTFDCNASTSGQTYTTCTPNYGYALSSTTQTETSATCTPSSFTCNASTYGQKYTTACEAASYGYGFSSSTVQAASCFIDETETCGGINDNGVSYVSTCDLVETP